MIGIIGALFIVGILLWIIIKWWKKKVIHFIGVSDGPTSIFIAGKIV